MHAGTWLVFASLAPTVRKPTYSYAYNHVIIYYPSKLSVTELIPLAAIKAQ